MVFRLEAWLQLGHLFAQDVQASVKLFVGDGSCVLLERDRIRSFVISQLDRRLDFDGGGKAERVHSFDFDPFQRRNFNENRNDSRLADGSIIVIRDEAANHILFEVFA